MHSNNKHIEVIRALQDLMEAQGLSQGEVASELSVSQGHLSKVLTGTQRLSRKMRKRIEDVYLNRATQHASVFESEVIAALKASPTYRNLVTAALKLVKQSTPHLQSNKSGKKKRD